MKKTIIHICIAIAVISLFIYQMIAGVDGFIIGLALMMFIFGLGGGFFVLDFGYRMNSKMIDCKKFYLSISTVIYAFSILAMFIGIVFAFGEPLKPGPLYAAYGLFISSGIIKERFKREQKNSEPLVIKKMKRSHIAAIVLICVLAIPVASTVYKTMLGFYGFKKQMCQHIVPRGLRVVEFEIPSQIKGGVDLAKFHQTDLSGVREWLLKDSSEAVSLLEKAFGNWESFRKEYPTDKNVLDATLAKRLPPCFERGSLSMQSFPGYYIFPLFPSAKDYSKEYALFGVKAILSGINQPFMTAEGNSHFFFVLKGGPSTEIVYGDKSSGKLTGSLLISKSITEKQISEICHKIELEAKNNKEN